MLCFGIIHLKERFNKGKDGIMAKIELAYSLEIQCIVDAMEANEMWIEGRLHDKRKFVCVDDTCDAKITCKNMDTFAYKRKMNPHFIMSCRENMHSLTCKAQKENNVEMTRNNNVRKEKDSAPDIGARVCFHLVRPENHSLLQHKENDRQDEKTNVDVERKKKSNLTMNQRKSNYYWLNSLIWYFVCSYKNNRTMEDKVEIDFGNENVYSYTLDELFKRIANETEISDKDKFHYIYYGKAKIFKRNAGGYDIVFLEKFIKSEKKVKCVISNEMIEACNVGRGNKIKFFDEAVGKEKVIYVLASKNVSDKYSAVYLNVKNLDSVAVSEVELGQEDSFEE